MSFKIWLKKIYKISKVSVSEEMAQWAKCLLQKHEDLSSDL